VADLEGRQIKVASVLCDVTERAAMEAAAARTVEAFGKVHLVCNNAGVGAGGPIGEVAAADWQWVVDVNLLGVVYGMEAFLPHLRSHGEGGWFVNTASMAGLISPPGMEPYSATKFAVVAMSEGWAVQLQPQGIGVSVLCPGFVKTAINKSGRTRQAKYGGAKPILAQAEPSPVDTGIDPEIVGRRVLEAVQADQFYIFTHPDMRAAVEARFSRIMAGFADAAASPALAGMNYKTPENLSMGVLSKVAG
jgi:NAD(P)-dependent dehydrogenase (short-subunit alcohol dehydrogenase family)